MNFTTYVADISKPTPKPHPLDPLTSTEIRLASQIITANFSPNLIPIFSTVTLKEPRKSELLPYFLNDTLPPFVTREAFATIMDPMTQAGYEVVVNLLGKKVTSVVQLDPGTQQMFTIGDKEDINEVVLSDPEVRRRLEAMGLTNLSMVVPLGGDFGYAGDRPEYVGKRIAQVFMTFQNFQYDNFFAHQVGFVAVVDILAKKMLAIEELPTTLGFETSQAPLGETSVPRTSHNYDPALLPSGFFRKDVHPITCSQKGGPSYKVSGYQVSWQKFKFRIGFNPREGLVLYHVNYNDNGNVRPLIYRASLSELFVPYGDPRPPYHRKMIYDAGKYGIGQTAVTLRPTPDCKGGSVHFFDVVVSTKAGLPVTIPSAICMYEDDAGVLMKKYNTRDKRSYTVRNQRLVITFTSSVGNYDYEWRWIFHQDASVRMEVNLQGIDAPIFLSSWGESVTPPDHGTVFTPTPGILAPNHQHLFIVRVDAEIDGNANTVAMVDVVPDGSTGTSQNPYGNGFKAVPTILKTPSQARTNSNAATARSWHIYGDIEKKHPFSRTPMGYHLVAGSPVHLMINPDSPLHPKCAFVDYTVWVTPYEENQLYAGGAYLNNSGLPEWVASTPDANLVGTDIVLWHVFGVTHIPRVEDFPAMSVETAGFWLKPVNFFKENPARDVPGFVHED
ncbi:Copper amine oxidase 1 [Folsomia candida]|uniref:Amine oxidase n=1 Tax=Folsomia candida TaxID=158441 RepID=A0A226EYD8_FOLCA|nr:Copper amine oxidase 1 [Folsomia candida]